MVVTPHRTKAHSPEEAAQHEASVPGMAHFAGTGPAGKLCLHCRYWNRGDLLTIRRNPLGEVRPAPCGKYEKLTEQAGFDVPATQRSCRHFEPSDNPPAFFIQPASAKPKKAGGR